VETSTLLLRAATLAVLLLGALQAVAVVAWYARARLVTLPRAWHVVSVGLGWLLLQLFVAVALVRTWVPFPLPGGVRVSFALVGQVFVVYGVHSLFWAARRRERKARA
jgi:hypothetical protein